MTDAAMFLPQVITAISQIPYVGPFAVYIPAVISIGAVMATVIPAPKDSTNKVYRAFYQCVQWCALNKGQGVNLTAPENKGLVAGPMALDVPMIAASAVPVSAPASIPEPLIVQTAHLAVPATPSSAA